MRYDKVCKDCRSNERKVKTQQVNPTPIPQDKIVTGSVTPSKRRYVYPDGRILELDEQEFCHFVKTIRLLLNEKRKREGRALLLG